MISCKLQEKGIRAALIQKVGWETGRHRLWEVNAWGTGEFDRIYRMKVNLRR